MIDPHLSEGSRPCVQAAGPYPEYDHDARLIERSLETPGDRARQAVLRTEEPTSGVDAWWQMARRRLLTREFFSFAFIGCVCTLLYIGVYSFSRIWLHPLGANSAALVLTAPPNFLANRVLTFRAGDGSLPKQAGQYAVFYALGIGGSSLALGAFLLVWAEPPRLVEFMAALLSTGVATVIRYLALSYWVFPARNDSVRILRARSRSAQTT